MKERFYAKINLEFDSEKIGRGQKQEIIGDEITIAALIGGTIHQLLEEGFDRKILERAIEEGLNENLTKKIQVKEIKLNDENKQELKEILKKLSVIEED